MRDQKGLTLVEVLIAVALFGIIASGLFMALNVSLKATGSTNERTIAESLTRSAHEIVQQSAYETDFPNYQDEVDVSITPPPGYTIVVSAVPIDGVTYADLVIPPDSDQGIQKVTVEVYFEGELRGATKNYKVDR